MRTPEERERLIDAILDEYEKGVDTFNRNGWKDRHGEKLGAYTDKMKALNGDDFDLLKESYDEYHNDYSDLSEDEYVDALVKNMDSVVEKIAAALGAPKEEVQEAVEEAVSEEAPKEEPVEETTTIETTDPDVAEKAVDEAASDELLKSHPGRQGKKFWGNPSQSGGRNGHTSDEKAKTDYSEIGEGAGKVGDAVKSNELEAKPLDMKMKDFVADVEKAKETYTRRK